MQVQAVNHYSFQNLSVNRDNADKQDKALKNQNFKNAELMSYPAGYYISNFSPAVSFTGAVKNLDEQKERIIKLYKQGKNQQQIADEIGCSRTGAGLALKRWGVFIPKESVIENNKDRIIELYRQGKPQREIAEIIGCNQTSIGDALKRWDVYMPKESIIENNKDRIIELYEQGKTQKQIADEIGGCTLTGIRLALKRWDVYMPKESIIENNKDQIIELYEQGKTYQEIADEIGELFEDEYEYEDDD